jgi:DNA-binding TFAR19-related protein (PDSD5 family)
MALPRCGGTNRQGGPCELAAGQGTDHVGHGNCLHHGGSTPNGIKHAASKRAESLMATYGLPRDITPAAALLEEVRYAAGHVAWLRGKVAELEPDALTWGVAEIAHKQATEFGGTDTTERAALNTWLEAYHRERRYLLDVSKAALAAGVEERLVQLAEAQGLAVVTVLARVFDRLQLTDTQRQLAAVAVPEELRAQSAP